MPKLYMLVGLPATGKSTWVESQKFDANICIASTDKHIESEASLRGTTYNDAFPRYYNEAKNLMDKEIAEAISNNHDIVWDQTNLNSVSRSKKLLQIPSNYEKIAMVFKLPNEKLHNKMLKRKGKTISQRVIIMMKESYEVPKLSEGFDKIIFVEN